MTYTVKKLAKLSGVSVRTLHFYDEIGLLKPAYTGENNYRYYEETQLLMLQQILFFRELGFQLSDIQKIICDPDFDKIATLESHRIILKANLNQTKNLIKTIDKTIAYLRGISQMKDEEIYYGFVDSEQQKQHEKYLVEKGIVTQELLDECNAKIKNWSDKEKNAFMQEMDKILKCLVLALESGLSPSDLKVQELMRQHYKWLQLTWSPTKETYLGLAKLYQTPDFKKFYDARHPKLLKFFVAAMKVYAERDLS